MDNILMYNRPGHQKDPNNPHCELHTKKIRRQKTVGKKGVVDFEYFRPSRRFLFGGEDNMAALLKESGLDFIQKAFHESHSDTPF